MHCKYTPTCAAYTTIILQLILLFSRISHKHYIQIMLWINYRNAQIQYNVGMACRHMTLLEVQLNVYRQPQTLIPQQYVSH